MDHDWHAIYCFQNMRYTIGGKRLFLILIMPSRWYCWRRSA